MLMRRHLLSRGGFPFDLSVSSSLMAFHTICGTSLCALGSGNFFRYIELLPAYNRKKKALHVTYYSFLSRHGHAPRIQSFVELLWRKQLF
jgi:hypothetical protein